MNAHAKPLANSTRHAPAKTLWTALTRFLRLRRDYRKLEEMPDHLLRDLGLTRSDIHRAIRANQPF